MASVNTKYKDTLTTLAGPFVRRWQLSITGLTQNATNAVPHGLPCGPNLLTANYRQQADGGWYEAQSPDATNLYIHVDASGPTSFVVDVDYLG